MDELLEQIESAVESNHYLLGLYVALSLPDVCAALQSPNGDTKPKKYKNWFDRWVAPKYQGRFTGEQCYAFRCGVVHQGRAQHQNLGYSRVIFVEPNQTYVFHGNVIEDAYNIDVSIFCNDMCSSAREWMEHMGDDPVVRGNLEHLLQRRPGGLPPYIRGVDVFA